MDTTVNNKRLYVGNLSWGVNDDSLRAAFAECGEIDNAQVAIDRMTGRSKGFAFVEFKNEEDAQKAVEKWNGQELDGRPLRVNIAQPKTEGGAPRRSYDNNRGGYGRSNDRGGYGRSNDRGGYNRGY